MRVYRSKPVPAPLCVVYSVVPTVVQYSLDGSGRRRKGPKGKVPGARMPYIQRVKGKKAKHTGNVYVHPDYGRKIKRSGAPKDSPPCPRARRYGYQFEYKSSSRLIYVRKANNRVTTDEQAHHTRAAAPFLNPISEGYLLTWALLPGYCESIGVNEDLIKGLILIHAYTVTTGRKFIYPDELQQYLRWMPITRIADLLNQLVKLSYLMLYAPKASERRIMRAIKAGEKPGRRFALTTYTTDLLITLYDYIEQFRENWNTEISPLQYVDKAPDMPII